MVLETFWGSLGFLLGALRAHCGGSWELSEASRSTKEGLQIRLGTLLGLVCSLLAAEDGFGSVLGLSLARFGCSRGPFKGCFGIRHTDFDHQNCPSELQIRIIRIRIRRTIITRIRKIMVFQYLRKTPSAAFQSEGYLGSSISTLGWPPAGPRRPAYC